MPKLAQTVSVSSDRSSSDVLQLIADYQRAARVAVGGLKRQTGTSNLLRAWKSEKISRSGRLVEPHGRYSFHGVGCRFEISGRIIDIDFGPAGRHDGFDADRLRKYANSAFEWLDMDDAHIDKSLRSFESSGLIIRPNLEPSPHLFYFADDLDSTATPAKRKTR